MKAVLLGIALLAAIGSARAGDINPIDRAMLKAEGLCAGVFTPTWGHRMRNDPLAYSAYFRQCAEVEEIYLDRAPGLKHGLPDEIARQRLADKRAKLSAVDFTRSEPNRSPEMRALFGLDVFLNSVLFRWSPLYHSRQSLSQHAAIAERRHYAIGRFVCRILGLFEPDHCTNSLKP